MPNHSQIIEQIAQDGRNSLSTYCMTVCQALCCKKGSLIITQEEGEHFKKKEVRVNGLVSIQLTPQCEHLKENKCSIYEKRPKPCQNFPIYIRGETILIAEWCEGYKAGLLEPFQQRIAKKGCKIIIV